MQEKEIIRNQNIILENRKKLTISGITDVDSFDEKAVCLYTQLGELTIQGSELQIDSMSVETGDMIIEGEIDDIHFLPFLFENSAINKLQNLPNGFIRTTFTAS